VFTSFNFRSNFSGKYQVNTYYGKYPVNTSPVLPGIYLGIYQFCLPIRRVFTWRFLRSPYSKICEISRNFEKIRAKMVNNPVGKKVNTPKGKYLGKYLFT